MQNASVAAGARGLLNVLSVVFFGVLCINEGYSWNFHRYDYPGYKSTGKEDRIKNFPNEYDFIIVGAGNAGAVLASRLSEISQWKILLVEAGGKDNLLSDIPLFAAYLQSTALNWNFFSEKQEGTCLGMKNERCPAPKGKGLGGSTIINYMIYNRGNRADFDNWARAGNEGWSYKDVLPYFMKSEKVTFPDTNKTPKHGSGGPVNVEYVPHRSPLVHAFVKANEQLGRKVVDYNGDSQLGVGYLQATTKHGKRVTSSSAYLNTYFKKNLHILTNARATKVLIHSKSRIANGIEIIWKKQKYKIYAKKEVILSAGSFQSPQLLMLSGIGPREHLEEHNIPVIVDSPVGKTMYDHLCLTALSFLTNTSMAAYDTERLGVPDVLKYKHGIGTLTVPGALEALAFVRTDNSTEPQGVPNIELLFLGGTPASDYGTGTVRGFSWKPEVYDTVFKSTEGQDQFMIAIMLFHPKSSGYIKLKDNNPLHWPLIYHNFLTEPEDLDRMVRGIKEALRLIETPVMKSIGARIIDTPVPSCTRFTFGDDDYWKCLVRSLASTLHHQVGTCRMGPDDDPQAVVSPQLLVHGVEKLRVVDASVMPYVITGHTQAAVYMIAEKASDMIKHHWDWGEEL
ncbi:glucose dehydrogenase [FAD, quinone]-like [Armigeres subalbatus]|uniref:glucose dehydrogenase [FAD, quinone]-like n=1 Tax=Armigeres subalbatus TaxID=124917 RepID=UPI002ED193F7